MANFHFHLDWSCQFGPSGVDLDSANGPAIWLDDTARAACDYSTPRSGHKVRKRVFWWCEELTELRVLCERAKKNWYRLRRRRHPLSEDAAQDYRLARNSFRYAIKKAKATAWGELIASIEEDPWGLPYKLILKRLRRSSPGLTEVLDEVVLRRLLDSLFPPGNPLAPVAWRADIWNDDLAVTPNEVLTAIRSRRKVNTAPGPNGLGVAIWKRVSPTMLVKMAACYSACLRRGCFPTDWKVATLVLIPKEGYAYALAAGDPDGQLPKVRPICLLNDVAKIFEYIIVPRVQAWMADSPRANLSPNQFGFRQGLSTCDAIRLVREDTREARATRQESTCYQPEH